MAFWPELAFQQKWLFGQKYFFQVNLLYWKRGLQTPNEGINQRNLKIWADVADKYALAVLKNLGVGVDFGRAVKVISSPGIRSLWLKDLARL
jgi:hypothetical protein